MDQEKELSATGGAAGNVAAQGPRFSRRSLLVYGAGAAACTAGAGVLGWFFTSRARAATLSEVFKNEAPRGELWEMWKARGWAREASHYVQLDKNVMCQLCPNECLLEPEDRGRCRNRVNKDGKLFTLAYANPTLPQKDWIEKKPLYHFLPESYAFSFATTGCGFRCLNCQNWDLSQRKPEEMKDARGPEVILESRHLLPGGITADEANRMTMPPEQAVALAKHKDCRSIAYTYSEPAVWFEYMLDTAKIARAQGVKNVIVTCGYIQPDPLKELCQYLDGAHVDLKGFTDESYRDLNSGKLGPILETLRTLHREKVWFEVINLIVPTYTDDPKMIRRMCEWLVDNLGPDYPLHFSQFRPEHKLTQLPRTPKETLLQARQIATEAGLHYVYIGNCRELDDVGTTLCAGCKKPLIVRRGYDVLAMDVVAGKCKHCHANIPGVWT
jgi:pyruvate formate lyase activating enzyme